jgi:hypothetical protein
VFARQVVSEKTNNRCREGRQASDAAHFFCHKECLVLRKILFAALPIIVIAAAALAFTTTAGALPVDQVKVGAESSPQLAFMHGHGSHGSSYGSYGSYRGSYDSYRSYSSYRSWNSYNTYRSWNSWNSYRDYYESRDFRGSREHGGMSDR